MFKFVSFTHLRHISFFLKGFFSLISEGNLRFSDKGIGFKAIDPSQIVLVDFFLDKKNFEKYEVEPSLIGVDLAELNKIMQRASTEDRLSMELSESELNLNLEGDQIGRAS